MAVVVIVFVVFVMTVFVMMAFLMMVVTIIVVILAACSALSREGAGSVDVGASHGHGAVRQDTSD